MVTHDMTEALLLADRIAVMRRGALVGIGSPRQILLNPSHPYVAALMETPKRQADQVESILRSGGDRDVNASALEEQLRLLPALPGDITWS